MVRFSYDEVQRLMALAGSKRAGRTLAECFEETFLAIHALVPHASTDIFLLEPARGRGQALYVAGMAEKDLLDYVRHYRFHDPMAPFIVRAAGQVKTLSDAASPREIARTEFSDILGRLRVSSVAGYSQEIGGGRYAVFAIHRGGRAPDFGAKERLIVSMVAPLVAATIAGHVDGPFAGMTPRQRAVAELAARGLSDLEIAERLGLGFPTVRTHIQKVFAKLRVSSRTELVGAAAGRPKR